MCKEFRRSVKSPIRNLTHWGYAELVIGIGIRSGIDVGISYTSDLFGERVTSN